MTKDKEYIERAVAIERARNELDLINKSHWSADEIVDFLKRLPAADVVLRSCFDRILAENDDMREQLKSVGKLPGDDMSDLEVVRHGRWNNGYEVQNCSECGYRGKRSYKYCPHCGAKMDGGVNDGT